MRLLTDYGIRNQCLRLGLRPTSCDSIMSCRKVLDCMMSCLDYYARKIESESADETVGFLYSRLPGCCPTVEFGCHNAFRPSVETRL